MSNASRWISWGGGKIPRRDFLLAITVVVGLVVILVGLMTACASKKEKGPGANVPGANEVWLIGWVYEPETIIVPVGATVSWNNTTRDYHTVTSDDGLFDSRLGGGQSFSYTFTESGTFAYHDGATDPPTTGKVVVK
ncbi:MAG: cupredoxin domain-containing protein [Dehalococcoidales bacterium]|nr:cupredoxin domain-containing protein [Dehalococcoidales bacterium]